MKEIFILMNINIINYQQKSKRQIRWVLVIYYFWFFNKVVLGLFADADLK